ncbi:TIGR03943 family putative permease subunit [Brevibacillus reuszeri]|uniref:TIGR03943 family putative permease subunit n=1 Tax=Brevibacillus reuszeri TaxID=54915 RepID=UPI000CCC9B23|nr:TIGR03943 family protein [Brevibacillus reuszeri]
MDQTSLRRHYWIRSVILSGFTLLLTYLIMSEKLSHYLAPRLHMFSYVTLGILVILTVVSIRQAIVGASEYECDCEDVHKVPRSPWISLIVYGLFLLPLAMGFLMPDKILGSDVAEKRGITLLSNDVRKLAEVAAATDSAESNSDNAGSSHSTDLSQSEGGTESEPEAGSEKVEEDSQEQGASDATKQEPANVEDEQIRKRFDANGFGDFYTDLAVSLYKQPVIDLHEKVFLDGLTTMELYANEFAGKEMETLGFVYRQTDFSAEQFVVARFSVSCCTADASVFGILVEKPDGSKWAKDSWVKVRGKLELRKVDGFDMLVLKANQVEPVKAPKDPYVYYSYDAASSS